MEHHERQAIEQLSDYLLENLNTTEVLTKVFSRGILKGHEVQNIQAERTDYYKNQKFTTTIVTKGDSFYDLLEILISSGQQHIANKINEQYKKLGGENPLDVIETKKVLDKRGWQQGESAACFAKPQAKREGQLSENRNPVNPSIGASGTTVSPSAPIISPVHPMANYEFNAVVEMNRIIEKFEKLTKEEKSKLNIRLPKILIEELNGCREMFENIALQGVVNNHMSAVLPSDTVKEIKKAIRDSNGAYEMCESLMRGSILALLTFLKGLQSDRQDFLFTHFSEAFCYELKVILGCEQAKSTAIAVPTTVDKHVEQPIVTVDGSSRLWRSHNEEYLMDKTPRGRVLIINNMDFQDMPERKGSDIDERTLVNLFKFLKFKTIVVQDQTCAEMLTTVAHFVSTYDWKEANAAVVCILSHGDDHNLIYGVDSVRSRKKGVPGAPSVQLRDLITKLNPKQCPGLEGKPKLFFIQACRGEREDGMVMDGTASKCPAEGEGEVELVPGEEIEAAIYGAKGEQSSGYESDSGNALSNIDDFLVSYATGWGYLAWRHKTEGSPYITELDRMLRAHPNTDIYNILTKVKNEVVKSLSQNQKSASPGFYTHLSKTLYLNK